MLSISNPMHGSARADYYFGQQEQLENLMSGGVPHSQWMGRLAEWMSLTGPVEKQTLRRLFDGFSPDGKAKIVENAGSPSRQSAWDLTFTAPKSVSVLLAFSDPEKQKRIIEIHDAAVRYALERVEDRWGYVRRGHSGNKLETCPFLLFATFRHGLSRELEPNLHTHAVLINVGARSDLSLGALYTKELFRNKIRAGTAYHVDLSMGLHGEGINLDVGRNGFEVAGISDQLCDRFSTRRKQIEALLKEKGWSGAVAAKSAARRTRRKKEAVDPERLFAQWTLKASLHGFDREAAAKLYPAVRKEQTAAAAAEAKEVPPVPLEPAKPERTPPPVLPARFEKIEISHRVSSSTVASFLAKFAWLNPFIIERGPLFPKAPSWSPISKIEIPRLAVKRSKGRRPPKRFSKAFFEGKVPFGYVQIRQKPLFPFAPSWSPAKKIEIPYISLRKKPSRPENVQRLRRAM